VVGTWTVFGMVDNIGSMAVERLYVCWHRYRGLLDVACSCRHCVKGWHLLALNHGWQHEAGPQLPYLFTLVGPVSRMAGCRVFSFALMEALKTHHQKPHIE
jgi:hypothetical protein